MKIGGVFLLARDPAALAAWYHRHLGVELEEMPDGTHYVESEQQLVFAIMPGDPGSGEGHIINYRVADIDAVLAALQEEGVEISGVTVGADGEGQGKFARLRDPEGHRIELWQHLDED